jgi:hypothetical protein
MVDGIIKQITVNHYPRRRPQWALLLVPHYPPLRAALSTIGTCTISSVPRLFSHFWFIAARIDN